MIDFLKLTSQQINKPSSTEGDFRTNINNDEPVSIHDIDKKDNIKPQENFFEQIITLEDTISSTETENTKDTENEGSITFIENCSNILEEKTQALNSLNIELSKASEDLVSTEEEYSYAANFLANVMNAPQDEIDENTIQEATQDFIKAQEKYSNAKEYENTLKEAISTTEKEKDKAKQELLGYVEILKNEQEKLKTNPTEETEDLQTTIDELNEEISISEDNSNEIKLQQEEKQKNLDTTRQNTQNQTGTIINDNNTISQYYDDGSIRTFSIEKDEDGKKFVTFSDSKIEQTPDEKPTNQVENSEFLEEIEQFIN